MSKAPFETFEGMVLSIRKHKEQDALVKIFTKEFGQRMFFIRNYQKPNHPMKSALLPFVHATYIGTISKSGLSFLRDYKEVETFPTVQQDLYLHAYATYFTALSDAAIEDAVVQVDLYDRLVAAIRQLEQGVDPEVLMMIVEMSFLRFFGVHPKLQACVVCGSTNEPFDYSIQLSGVLCQNHFHEDPKRLHASPAAIHFCRLFLHIHPSQIQSIAMKEETKNAIKQVISFFYDEFVGIHLKSKTYIENMYAFEQSLQLKPRKQEEPPEA